MITLPTNHPYFFTCPSCGCKLISVSTGNRAKPHCPKCDYSADDAFVVKDRVTSEAMNVIADNTELAENFAETGLTSPCGSSLKYAAATRMVASTQSPVRKARFIPETFRPSAFGAAILAPETASVRKSVLLKSASIPAMTLLTMSSYPLSC